MHSEQLESVEFKGHLSTVEPNAFSWAAKLSGVTFTCGVDFLGEQAFCGCTGLTDIDWGEGVKNIDKKDVFSGIGMKNLMFPEGLETPTLPLAGGSESISVTFQQGLKEIKGDVPMYSNAYGVRNNIDVTIPEEVPTTYIDEEDYQEMLEDMQEEEEETPEEPVSARRRALRVLRENSLISTFKGYGKLFDGVALFRDGKSRAAACSRTPQTSPSFPQASTSSAARKST